MRSTTSKPLRFSLRALSIRQQLPLLICLLLLVVILLFGAISFWGIRTAALAIGEQRLHSLTGQLASLLGQSARNYQTSARDLAGRKEIMDYLNMKPGDPSDSIRTLTALKKLFADSQAVRLELRDPQGKELIHFGRNIPIHVDPPKTDSTFVGRLYPAGDSMYYPIGAQVSAGNKPLGFLIQWRPIRATQKSVTQLSQLLGGKAALYLANTDGSLWTDMLRPVPSPSPVWQHPGTTVTTVSYKRPGGSVMAYATPIPGTPWLVMIELSRDLILEAANRFLYWMMGIGTFLIVAGSLIAWLISRSFTRPLNRLLLATDELAHGHYAEPVATHRRDELGRLEASFHSMAKQVRHTREELENKVRDRTRELEAVNKELEAFSYSVSHDLRAPLRAVSGYTMMLKEDYQDSFDAEAKRITGNILSNVKMMGRLIDDLLAFSHLGKKAPHLMITDMQQLAESCIAGLTPSWPDKTFRFDLGEIPPCLGDKDLLKQVWMNLIGNAMKYSSKEADPHITIGATAKDPYITYFVRDNGAGFDSRYADKLFKVFQRLHSHEEFEGTGIGLALVKRILDKHKGEIWAESSPGNGAVFYFRLKAAAIRTENHQS